MTKTISLTLLMLLLSFQSAFLAQMPGQSSEPAAVTFYSSGPTIVKPGSVGAFMGKIYVDGQEFGRLGRHEFVTFKLSPGSHVFGLSSWMGRSPDRHARLTISVEAEGQYFISTNFWGGPAGGLLIRQVTCEAALGDNANTKPLNRKKLKPDGAAVALTGRLFPQCR